MLGPVSGREKAANTEGARHAWTSRDLATLREHACEGAESVAAMIGCTPCAVRKAAQRHRISLRLPGSRRGLVLGQPRGVSLRRELREDIISGVVSDEAIARRMSIDDEADLCPVCCRRPQEVRSTGLCTLCHMRRLAEAHLQELEQLDGQRALWSSRQALCRARRRTRAEA